MSEHFSQVITFKSKYKYLYLLTQVIAPWGLLIGCNSAPILPPGTGCKHDTNISPNSKHPQECLCQLISDSEERNGHSPTSAQTPLLKAEPARQGQMDLRRNRLGKWEQKCKESSELPS